MAHRRNQTTQRAKTGKYSFDGGIIALHLVKNVQVSLYPFFCGLGQVLKKIHSFYSPIAFSALTLLVGRQEGHPKRGSDLHMTQRIPLPLTVSSFSKIQTGLPFWLTWVVPDKRPLNGCARVRACVRVFTNIFLALLRPPPWILHCSVVIAVVIM